MKVAYIYDVENKSTYAGQTVALGFRNAFKDMGFSFRFFSTLKIEKSYVEKFKLCLYNPDLIFTSVENIGLLPLDYLKQKKMVLWGQFYSPCDYEPQIHSITKETKNILNKYNGKHDILIWSQHSEEINEHFFSGYKRELGLKFIQLLHAADKTKYVKPIDSPIYDFIWAGNIAHRQDRYQKIIGTLKGKCKKFLDFNEVNSVPPQLIENNEYYRKSVIAPNIHTRAQVRYQILLNERVFTSPLLGGFQVCDNMLAKKYFESNELIIAENTSEILDAFYYYRDHPSERTKMINKLAGKILSNHSYHKRIDTILEQFF